MNELSAEDISLVLPTFNRASALERNLDSMLALEGICELIVVDDGSTDNTIEVCKRFDDRRIKLVSHPHNLGVASARNTGVDAANGSWVLFGEDDCRFPSNYAVVLRDIAERHNGDIVGAPLLHLRGTDSDAAGLADRMPRVTKPPSMDDVDIFPLRTIETPFVPARVLVRMIVFERARFYEGFPVNGYREETDFFVQAVRVGFRCLLTPDTYCYQLANWSGGQHHSPSWRYEYWTQRNNWQFLRRHGSWLVEQGYISSRIASQVRFLLRRGRIVSMGFTRARLTRAWAQILRRHKSASA